MIEGRITQVHIEHHSPDRVHYLGGNHGFWEAQRPSTATILIQVTGDALYQFRKFEDLLGGMVTLSLGRNIPQQWPGTDDALKKWIYCSLCDGKGCKACSWSGSMVATLPRCGVCGGVMRATQKQCGHKHE